MSPTICSNYFILEAFDRELLWCPVAQARFHVADVDALRTIVGEDADDDPKLDDGYYLDDGQVDEVVARFDIQLDRSEFCSGDIEFRLYRWHQPDGPPWFIWDMSCRCS